MRWMAFGANARDSRRALSIRAGWKVRRGGLTIQRKKYIQPELSLHWRFIRPCFPSLLQNSHDILANSTLHEAEVHSGDHWHQSGALSRQCSVGTTPGLNVRAIFI